MPSGDGMKVLEIMTSLPLRLTGPGSGAESSEQPCSSALHPVGMTAQDPQASHTSPPTAKHLATLANGLSSGRGLMEHGNQSDSTSTLLQTPWKRDTQNVPPERPSLKLHIMAIRRLRGNGKGTR